MINSAGINFNIHTPHILVVDNFYKYPHVICDDASKAQYTTNDHLYKGERSRYNFLYPYVKEEFERLLNVRITDWLSQPMNGVFQITRKENPLVWHSDSQDYAGAIYLTHDNDNIGTSFWKSRSGSCRRPANHPLENKASDLNAEIYSDFNLVNPDNWLLVDRVGSVFNRLVLWDAKLIHSATMYPETERLVQLFFFNIQK